MASYRSRTFETSTAQTAAWLLEQGATVVVRDDGIRRRVISLVQNRARDGDDYDRLIRQLRATGRGEPIDERVLFASAWKKKIIGITGSHGKTTAMLWAAHLIGNAITIDPTTDTSVMASTGSRASVALMESPPRVVRHTTVSTDDEYGQHRDGDEIASRWGAHNVPNYAAAVHAARLMGISWDTIHRRSATLPQIPHCQEVIYHARTLTIVDDSAAVSPERGTAAVRRWGAPNCVLIAGGDGVGDWNEWAAEVVRHVPVNNMILIAGDATANMRRSLGISGRGIRAYETLKRAYREAQKRARVFLASVIVYSPAACPNGDVRFDELVRSGLK